MDEKLTSEMQIAIRIVDSEPMKLPFGYAKCKTFTTESRTSMDTIETTDGSHVGGFKNALRGGHDCRKSSQDLITFSEQSEKILKKLKEW